MAKGAAPSTTQTSSVKLSPQQEELFNLALPFANQYANNPPTPYQGPKIAGFNPLELAAQSGYVNQGAPQAQNLANQAQASQAQLLDPNFQLNVANNPYLAASADAITGRATDNLMQNILPGIRSGATTAGGMYGGNSSRQALSEAGAIGNTSTGISRELADMYSRAYTTGLGSMQNAISQNPNVMAQGLFPSDVLGAVGQQQRSMDQAMMSQDVSDYYTNLSLPFMNAQNIMQLISGMPGATATSTATGSVPQANPIMSGLGGAAMGASLAPMLGMAGPVGMGLGALVSILGSR